MLSRVPSFVLHVRGVAILGALALFATACDRPEPHEIAPTLRLFEVRLSSTATYAPCADPAMDRLAEVRCAERPPLVPGLEESSSTTRGEAEPGAGKSADELNEEGRQTLAYAADAASLDRALARLQAAVDLDPTAAHLNDLAAAHYVRAQLTGSAIHLVYALDAVERAWAEDAGDPVVAFNRALIRDRLHLLELSRDAWDDYLALGVDEGWQDEARARRAAVPADGLRPSPAEASAAEDPGLVVEHVESELLRWVEHLDSAPDLAQASLDLARRRANELAEATGDRLLADALAGLAAAVGASGAERAERFRRAFRLYASASSLQARELFGDSREVADQTAAEFDALDSLFSVWARRLAINSAYHDQRFDDLERLVAEIDRAASDMPSSLTAGVWMTLGSARFADGRLHASEAALAVAGERYAAVGNEAGAVAVRLRRAPLTEWLGDVPLAWDLRHETLSGARSLSLLRERRLAAFDGALAALDLGADAAALVLMDESLRLAERSDNPRTRFNAHLKRAEVLRRAGQPGGEATLAAAAAVNVETADEAVRDYNQALLSVERGRSLLAVSPAEARRAFEEAVALFRSRREPLQLPAALVGAARAARLEGETAVAEAMLSEALSELDRQRSTVPGDTARIFLADAAAAARREAISIQLDAGQQAAALAILEDGRATRLHERLREVEATPGVAATDLFSSLPGRLPPDVAVVTWALLADETAIWAWSDAGGEMRRVPVGREGMGRRVRATLRAISNGGGEREALADLYELLVAPVAGRLAGRERLVVVPDGELHRLPFAALVDREGRHLVESHEVARALSLTGLDLGGGAVRPLVSALALVDPAFDRKAHPALSALGASRKEGAVLSTLYPRAEQVGDSDATEAALLEGLRKNEVVHVSAHGLVSAHDPFLSSLLLAPGGAEGAAGDGNLTAAELLAAGPMRARLVVLAACDSLGTHVSESEGPLGLAWPLLANGVGQVVATLWPVEDREASKLFVRFHEAVAAGESGPAALRAAQLRGLQEGDAVVDWASGAILVRE